MGKKSLHPQPEKRGLVGSLKSILSPVAAALAAIFILSFVDEINPWWVRWILVICVATTIELIVRQFGPRKMPEWVAGPPKDETIVYASYWPGEVSATPESIRAALLTALRSEGAHAYVVRQTDRVLEAENQPEGWLLRCGKSAQPGAFAAYRTDGGSDLKEPGLIGRWLALPGDFFTFEEAEAALLWFAESGETPPLIEWREPEG